MTGPAIVLIDRDGTIIRERHHLRQVDHVELLEGAGDALARLRLAGHKIAVITNQSVVGRGLLSMRGLDEIHERMRQLLAAHGADVDGIFVCPHVPAAGCRCRKPRTGLVQQAASELDFHPSAAIVIGDKATDMGLGRATGATTILVRTGYGSVSVPGADQNADFVVDDLAAAAEIVLGIERAKATGLRHLDSGVALRRVLAHHVGPSLGRVAVLLRRAFSTGGRVLIFGNGGSAADAQHFAAELTGLRVRGECRKPLAAIALTTDSSFLTCYANDVGFHEVFARQIEALGRPGDVAIGLSTSGRSMNVVRGLAAAQSAGLHAVALTGAEGATMATHADVTIQIPSDIVALIQESHMALLHALAQMLDDLRGPAEV
jgi:histidinol-phosphate phosphatase family protein